MNNKLIIPIGAVAVVILANAGFFLFRSPQGSPQGINDVLNNEESNKNISEEMTELGQMFVDAFEGNSSIKCVYSQDGIESTSYIKRGMMRVDSTGSENEQSNSMIYKGPIVYTWKEGSAEGFMIDTSKTSEIDESEVNQSQPFQNPKEVRDQIEQSAPTCSKENVPDSLFVPPTNINFQSMDQMMDNITEQLPEGVELPEGFELPEGH